MTDSLASPNLTSRRAIRYGLLQLVIAAVCVLLFYQPDPPSPPDAYRLSQGEISTDGGATWSASTLPYFQPRGDAEGAAPVFRTRFDHAQTDGGRSWSVFLPRFTSGVEILVNGTAILDTRRNPATTRVDRNFSVLAPIPPTLLKDGANDLVVRLHVWGPLTGYLDTLYVGPDADLRPANAWRVFLFVLLPLALAIWQAMLCMILGLIFYARRDEKAYGWLAAAMAVGAVQHFLPMPAPAPLQGLLGAAGSLECALTVYFAAHFTGTRLGRWGRFVFLPAIVIYLSAVFGTPEMMRIAFVTLGPTSIGLFVLLVAAILGRAAIRDGDGSFVYLGSTITVVIVFWGHDMLTILNILPGERLLLGRLFYSTVPIAIGLGLTWRFIRALNIADTFNARLVERVRETEEKLRSSFVREEEQNRKEALSAERTRLMRDLHDGLGGQLVSIVALAEQSGGTAIGDAARAALKDLRLVIDAMEEVDGDLMLVLGSWRERMAAQLRAHHIALSWQVLKPEGLPIFPGLRPFHVIQIVRLLDEAVTNAIKHSGAKTVRVTIDIEPDSTGKPGGRIAIEDDGKGFDMDGGAAATGQPRPAGRGLLNMKRRAEFIGATLSIVSSEAGTSVILFLPSSIGSSGPGVSAQART